MGLIEFVQEAGEVVLDRAGLGSQPPGRAAAPPEARPTAEELPAVLKRTVELLEIPVENLGLQVAGDTITVTGTSPTQADREKLVLVLGNTRGISRVQDELHVVKAEPEATYYTVVRGDSLSKIAKVHYGDATMYPAIFEANRPMLTDPDKIYPGQQLRIPPVT